MPRGTKAEKEVKRRTVAKGVVAGKTTRRIAKEAGCTERHVQRVAAEKPTQFLIADMLRPHRAKLSRLAEKAIKSIESAMAAKHTDKSDHKVRLWAVDRYKDLVELAQGGKPAAAPVEDRAQFTWEEFCVVYHARKVKDGESDD